MTELNIINGDCFEEIKKLSDNSIDLIITSPPYSDIISYGKEISVKKPNEYVDWLLPIFDDIYRVLKPCGSFILNINDNCSGGYKNTFVYEMVYRSSKETKLKFYDTYIWHKKNGIPNGGNRRFRNNTEFIFHFCKDNKQMKFYMDRVLIEPRIKNKTIKFLTGQKNKTKEGYKLPQTIRTLPDKVRPDNVVRFATAGASRDNIIKHPAPFNKELPLYYINLLTNKNDIVLDIFSGIGTTGIACKELDRNYIGFELNKLYCDFSKKRIEGYERYNEI